MRGSISGGEMMLNSLGMSKSHSKSGQDLLEQISKEGGTRNISKNLSGLSGKPDKEEPVTQNMVF